MKRSTQKTFVLTISLIVIMLIAGCEEQNLTNTRKARLIATENIQLKKELEQRDKKLEKQKKLIGKCLEEKKTLEGKSEENIEVIFDSILTDIVEENKKMRKENKELKAQVEQLQAQIEQLEEELQEIKGQSGPQPLPSTPKPL